VAVQVTWLKCVTERAYDYTLIYGNANANVDLTTGFYKYGNHLQCKAVEFFGDTISYYYEVVVEISLFWKYMTPKEDKTNDTKGSFYEEL
jgi:hypothetical protein